jgi:hypothetical protein
MCNRSSLKGSGNYRMNVALPTVAQLQEFLDATQEVTFTGAPGEGDQQRYEHISRVLKRLAYTALGVCRAFQYSH